ncbi:Cytochrome b5-like Heme/Steroid binding domain-containing protein [Candidatus Planktophila dulcis]|uniref:cytochrome b5 domain-containing protein n=1 Tax=Candidatus Planktophila dulcis TaxID=1884914 RepID=UPI000BAC7434|nr:cytochrome b5-like heme/steroid binding domain-containing protein [Candidatus Planktophila dulcis]ASY21047.1 Cytochrome b5-like Heme/Steroid binding domain-containing protein [Candidatus Planktophila dulcis]
MYRRLTPLIAIALAISLAPASSAHQPVVLLDTDTTPSAGPLLVDGTISFAIRASFTKSGQKKAFRASLKEGDLFSVQYLIVDKKPESGLKNSLLPQLVITSPTGKKITVAFKERTPFFETYSRTTYLYLSRVSQPAEAGIYSFVITSRARAAITVAVGDREVQGEVVRGAAPTPTVKPTPAATQEPAKASPTPEVTTQSAYTMAKVKENNSAASCWSVISGNVYNLTQWINQHPGGPSAIRGLCGVDGSSSFNGKHGRQSNPNETLAGYLLGPLVK